jgi:hypothetical protein
MSAISCEECRIGRYRATTAPYLQWIGGRMVVFPNAPAYVCDMCHYMKYDVRFLRDVEYMLDKLRQRSTQRRIADSPRLRATEENWRPSHQS